MEDRNDTTEYTGLEVLGYQALEALNLPFRKQVWMGVFCVDALILDQSVAVEFDGCGYHGCVECGWYDPVVAAKQTRRDRYLWVKFGLRVIHIPSHDMDTLTDVCIAVTDALYDLNMGRKAGDRRGEADAQRMGKRQT